jgi:WD40 repeat protein
MFACTFTADGAHVLSAGWDGHLRLWEAGTGAQLAALAIAKKPLSACAVAPDGKAWLAGSLEGMLTYCDPATQQRTLTYLAHTRPVSAIVFDTDGKTLATASWDRSVILWQAGSDRDGRPLSGHDDIVAGCRFTPDGRTLLSWSHDGTVRLWDTGHARLAAQLTGHEDRVTAAAVAPDGVWAASGSRDGGLKLWDLQQQRLAAEGRLAHDVRACCFLLDGESLVTVEANGRLLLCTVPGLQVRAELVTRIPLQCAMLAPNGARIALGCDDGRVRFVAVEGLDGAPLVVTATRTSQRTTTVLGRLLGKTQLRHRYSCTCPSCQQSFELPEAVPGQPRPCPHCRRPLRFSAATRVIPEKEPGGSAHYR